MGYQKFEIRGTCLKVGNSLKAVVIARSRIKADIFKLKGTNRIKAILRSETKA